MRENENSRMLIVSQIWSQGGNNASQVILSNLSSDRVEYIILVIVSRNYWVTNENYQWSTTTTFP